MWISAKSNVIQILLYKCPTLINFRSKTWTTLELVEHYIFWIFIHHTSLLGIWFSWTLSVLTLVCVKATRERKREQKIPKFHERHIWRVPNKSLMWCTCGAKGTISNVLSLRVVSECVLSRRMDGRAGRGGGCQWGHCHLNRMVALQTESFESWSVNILMEFTWIVCIVIKLYYSS